MQTRTSRSDTNSSATLIEIAQCALCERNENIFKRFKNVLKTLYGQANIVLKRFEIKKYIFKPLF